MNVVCTHCAHEFEMTDEAVAETGGAAKCPACGEETSLGSIPSGATLPWHPEMDGAPPGPAVPAVPAGPAAPPEAAGEPMFDAAEAAGEPMFDAAEADDGAKAPAKPKEQSVLFKLGAMQSMGMQSSARQGDGPPEASGLLDIRMLAATMHRREEEERASHKVQFMGRTKGSVAVALPTSSPALAMTPTRSKGKGGLIAAAVVFLVLIVAALVLVYVVYAVKTPKAGGGDSDSETRASVAMSVMKPSMRAAPMDAMEPDKPDKPKKPSMRTVAKDTMEPAMKPDKPKKPKKRPRKLRRKHIKEGVATVADKIAACKKDRKGRFKLRITVVGKTGKVKRVRIIGRSKRRSKTGKCLKALFKKAQFPPFKRRRQTFTHRVRIK